MQNHELRGTKQVGNDYYWNFPSYLFELVDQKCPHGNIIYYAIVQENIL